MADLGITYSLKYQARALSAFPADKHNSKWIVGTNSLREENEVRILEYDPDQERLTSYKTYRHAPEVWSIAACPDHHDSFITVWNKGGTYGASLWHANLDDSLQQTADLTGAPGALRSVVWHPQQSSVVLVLEEGSLRRWHVGDDKAECVGVAPAGELLQLWCAALHPSNPSLAVTGGSNSLQLWDLRGMAKTGEVVGAHKMPVRDVSWAAGCEYRLASGGDDCRIRVWDTRYLGKGEALLELGGHSHWVWCAQMSPCHDQLLASASSDSLVNLYYLPQLASSGSAAAPGPASDLGGAAGSDAAPRSAITSSPGPARSGDLHGKAHSWDEHEDSVYGLAWSCSDPWLLASMSYDGRVVVNKVPKNVKVKCLI